MHTYALYFCIGMLGYMVVRALILGAKDMKEDNKRKDRLLNKSNDVKIKKFCEELNRLEKELGITLNKYDILFVGDFKGSIYRLTYNLNTDKWEYVEQE